MKKYSHHIALIIFALATCGCTDTYDGRLVAEITPHYLNISQTVFHLSYNGSTTDFGVHSANTPWTFTDTPDWIYLSPMQGTESASIKLSTTPNLSSDNARTAIFFLKSTDSQWQFNRALSVSQDKAYPEITLGVEDLNFNGVGGSQTVKVTSNGVWSANASQSWLTISSANDALTVTAEPNMTNDYRTATITITYGEGYGSNKYKNIDVSQSPFIVGVSEQSLEFDRVASKYIIEVDCPTDWVAQASKDWISLSPAYGNAGKTTIAIEVSPNNSTSTRTGYVSILIDKYTGAEIKVIQKGIYLEVNENLTFNPTADSKSLTISSNTEWEITNKPDWVTLSKNAGNGNDNITVTCEANQSTSGRSGMIVVTLPGLSLQCTVAVNQSGVTFSANTTVLEFSDKAEQQTFALTTNTSWLSSHSATWFSSTPMAGTGSADITVDVQENASTSERSGTISYDYGQQPEFIVSVHQMAKYMSIENSTFEFDSKGGTHTIALSTDASWTAKVESTDNWIKLSKTSGTGSADFTITAIDNPSTNSRSATVTISPEDGQGVVINVSQKPRYLTLSAQSLSFYGNGGTSEPIIISTDGIYEINSKESWLTINKDSGNLFSVSAAENTTGSTRTGLITISLTDIKEGTMKVELNVTQVAEHCSFVITGYQDDVKWDTGSNKTSPQHIDTNSKNKLKIKVINYFKNK